MKRTERNGISTAQAFRAWLTTPGEADTADLCITPDMALEGLRHNDQNRSLQSSLVARYADEMAAGTWAYTHAGIAFDRAGQIVDGQHRLAAVAKSGKSQRFLVTRNLHHDARLAIDIGAKRTAGDILAIHDGVDRGKRRVAIVRALAALTREIKHYGQATLTIHEIRLMLDRYRIGIDWTLDTVPAKYHYGPFCAAFAYAYPTNRDKVAEFVARADDGVGLEAGSSVLAWRDFVARGISVGAGNAYRRDMTLKTLTALKAYIEGDRRTRVYASDAATEYFAKAWAEARR